MDRLHSLKILAGLAAVSLLSACSQDGLTDGTPLEEKTPLELTASNLYEAVATPKTRGTIDGNWQGAKTVAVRVNGKIKEYTVSSGIDGKTILTCNDITEDDTEFWWTKNGESKTVDAWYPYSDTQPTDWKVSLEQTAETIAQEDLMYASSTPVTLANSAIEFEHMLTKVVINLVDSEYLQQASDVSVSLTGQYQTGEFKIKTGSGKGYMAGKILSEPNCTITPYLLPPSPDDVYYATYEALCIPDFNVASINIEVDEATYQKSMFPQGVSSGQQYVYTITVKEEGLEVSPQISGWTDGADASGTIVIE